MKKDVISDSDDYKVEYNKNLYKDKKEVKRIIDSYNKDYNDVSVISEVQRKCIKDDLKDIN